MLKKLNKPSLIKEFKYFTDMLGYSIPIHGGWALGVERFLQKILFLSSLSEISAFPKNHKFECSFTKAPN